MKKNNQFIKSITKYLKSEYGEVKPEWELIIQLLADNIELYLECQKSIEENGIFNSETYKKNPLLATCKDLQATILKQIQHLGISPYAFSKINIAEENDTDDFLSMLTGEKDK